MCPGAKHYTITVFPFQHYAFCKNITLFWRKHYTFHYTITLFTPKHYTFAPKHYTFAPDHYTFCRHTLHFHVGINKKRGSRRNPADFQFYLFMCSMKYSTKSIDRCFTPLCCHLSICNFKYLFRQKAVASVPVGQL